MDDETLKRATPRPWHYEPREFEPDRLIGATTQVIADIYCTDMPDGSANRDLIVAAVNQFEALRAVAVTSRMALGAFKGAYESYPDATRLREALSRLAEVERGICARCGKSHD